MFLSAGSLVEFARFLQVVLLIGLSLVVVVYLVMAVWHYRKRKKTPAPVDQDSVERWVNATPEYIHDRYRESGYVYIDQPALLREYRNKLAYSHARYTALRHDFAVLQSQHTEFPPDTNMDSYDTKTTDMKDQHVPAETGETREPAATGTMYETEKEEWISKFDEVNKAYKILEQENRSLHDQLKLLSGTDPEKETFINDWKKEKKELEDRLDEQAFLGDLLEQKKLQVAFIQEQLEKQVMRCHKTEQQLKDMNRQLGEERKNMETARASAERHAHENQVKNQEAGRLQQQLCEKEALIVQKQDAITWLENNLQETRQQNELLQALTTDHHERVKTLEDKLSREESKRLFLQEKLDHQQQTLRRLIREVSLFAGEEDSAESPAPDQKTVLSVIR